jgi:ribosomal protein S27AE
MEALDGNAIAGALYDVFGTEMTTATGTCAHCGASGQIAELRVYSRAPGAVARCWNCGNVVFVLAEISGATRIHLDYFQLADNPLAS